MGKLGKTLFACACLAANEQRKLVLCGFFGHVTGFGNIGGLSVQALLIRRLILSLCGSALFVELVDHFIGFYDPLDGLF
ncbi:MAG: hypothetical protein OIF54_07505, partial [Cohaesibacter sp.]|nr:hypothetical protein [Cohaesibacter sp.]